MKKITRKEAEQKLKEEFGIGIKTSGDLEEKGRELMKKQEKEKKFSKYMGKELDKISKDYDMSMEEMAEAIIGKSKLTKEYLKILTDPNLFKRINKEFGKRIEREEKSRKVIFLSLCNIWVKDEEVPLNNFVSSASSVGKSYICKNIIAIFPKELVEYRTKITPEAFTYWHNSENEPEWSWNGKICYLEDVSQGILDSPTFKVMCSEGSIATIVDKGKAKDIHIKGKPVMLVTSAQTNPKAEVLGRFQITPLDETKEQTKAIVFRQAKNVMGGRKEKYDEKITEALRFQRRKKVIIPYAEKIASFLGHTYNFDDLRLRRDFSRLLGLIKNSAALYQYQRKEKKNMLVANEQDYEIARECINYIKTYTFKGLTHKLKKAFDCCKKSREFTAKEIYSQYPIVSQQTWYGYLDDLLERGMLTTELRKVEGSDKDVRHYGNGNNRI